MNDQQKQAAANNGASFREQRRQHIAALLGEHSLDALLVTSRENTRYLTGFSGTESQALIFADHSTILVDCRYIEQAGGQCTGMEAILVTSQDQALKEQLEKSGVKRLGVEDESITMARLCKLRELLPGVEFIGLSKDLSKLRMIKDEHEKAIIKSAVKISDDAWAELLPQIKVGMTEKEVAGRLEYLFRLRGASGPSFDTIMASGARSAMPHGVASDKKIEFGDIMVMDFGCLYEGYCSDITRTIFVGQSNEEMVNIYNIVLEAQLKAEREIRAGMRGIDCDKIARDVIEEAGFGQYFGHSLGHSIGLLIHEPPNFAKSCLDPIPAGAVLSVEPGIYLEGRGGVRIEDIGMVHEDHYEVFTQASKELTVVPG